MARHEELLRRFAMVQLRLGDGGVPDLAMYAQRAHAEVRGVPSAARLELIEPEADARGLDLQAIARLVGPLVAWLRGVRRRR